MYSFTFPRKFQIMKNELVFALNINEFHSSSSFRKYLPFVVARILKWFDLIHAFNQFITTEKAQSNPSGHVLHDIEAKSIDKTGSIWKNIHFNIIDHDVMQVSQWFQHCFWSNVGFSATQLRCKRQIISAQKIRAGMFYLPHECTFIVVYLILSLCSSSTPHYNEQFPLSANNQSPLWGNLSSENPRISASGRLCSKNLVRAIA